MFYKNMKSVTVMAVKYFHFFLCRTFYTSLYTCILQNMKYVKAMLV